MDKYQLSERDICTKFITPAIQQAGWQQHQFREEVSLTDGRVMVRGKLAARIRNPEAKGGPKRADFVLYARPSVPIAVVEAKQARFSVGHGMQQALTYAEMLDAPFAISSNGDGFLLHDRTGLTQPIERELALDAFPSLEELWPVYQQWKGLADPAAVKLIEQPFYTDGSGREVRYYQRVAINRASRKVWQNTTKLINKYLQALSDARTSGAARERLKAAAREIVCLTKPDAELSAVAKWCVRLRNDSQLSRLVG